MKFSTQIIAWYNVNKRDLPWRNTTDPYKIWLSEIILQQTRVEQGMKYYHKFIMAFPTIGDMANASEGRIMKLWQGLGYYNRARNMLETARFIKKEYKGIFPSEYTKIMELKGVGEYTAAAIASFAFNKNYAVIDGNVTRVLARMFGITEPVDVGETKKVIQEMAIELLPGGKAAIYNQAIMEFGALICKPLGPLCGICFMRLSCFAWKNRLVTKLPFKSKTPDVKDRYFNYLVIIRKFVNRENIYIHKRTEKDIWRNLYDFPCIETNAHLEFEKLIYSKEWKLFFGTKHTYIKEISEIIKHQLTHQTIHARFIRINIWTTIRPKDKNIILIPIESIEEYAMPRLIEKYLQSL
jgi:A/G-specific adenine glycosylase